MTRGRQSPDGSTFVNKNGYHHTKVGGKWIHTAVLVAEKKLGRKLREGERVRFIDGDKANLSPDNIRITVQKPKGPRARLAEIEAQIEELLAEKAHLESKLNSS